MIGPDMGALTLWELAVERADRSPGAVFAISEDGTETTFSELRDRAAHLAEWFGQHGVSPGESVVWQLPTGVEAVTLALALSRLGAVQIPVLPSLGRRELGHVLTQTGGASSRCPLPVGTARSSRAGQPRPRVHACPGAAGAVRDRECSGRRVADPPPSRSLMGLLYVGDHCGAEGRPPFRRHPHRLRPWDGGSVRCDAVGSHRVRVPGHAHRWYRVGLRHDVVRLRANSWGNSTERPLGRCDGTV